MRKTLVLLSALALVAACATPREACINSAQRELRVVNGLISETQVNLARGYAVVDQQEVRVVRSTCPVFGPDGAQIGTTPCEQPETVTTQVPQAIDLNAEQAKLQSLLQRRNQMDQQVQAQVQQCLAANPE
jgi:hypothetical protein